MIAESRHSVRKKDFFVLITGGNDDRWNTSENSLMIVDKYKHTSGMFW